MLGVKVRAKNKTYKAPMGFMGETDSKQTKMHNINYNCDICMGSLLSF